MKPLLQDVEDVIAFYKSKSELSTDADLPEGTYIYRTASFILHIPDPYFSQPPLDVERKHHFNNIAQRYRMPEDIPARDLQAYAVFLFHEYRGGMGSRDGDVALRIDRLYDLMIEKNPVLAAVPIYKDSLEQKYHVVMGAISAFNLGDIQHFVSGKTGIVSRKDPAWQVMNQRLEASGIETYWVPSMLTLRDMSQQLFQQKCAKELKSPGRPSAPKP